MRAGAHNSRRLTNDIIEKADQIWCITPEHKDLINQKFPDVENKVNCLDSEGMMPVPHGKGVSAYIECAKKLEEVIDSLIYKEEIQFI